MYQTILDYSRILSNALQYSQIFWTILEIARERDTFSCYIFKVKHGLMELDSDLVDNLKLVYLAL